MIKRTESLEDRSIRYSRQGTRERYIVDGDALREIALALRSPDQHQGEQMSQEVIAQMQRSREERAG